MNGKLKMAILESGMAAYKLAQRVGISDSALSRIVHGRREPTALERQRIAKVLACREDELFDRHTQADSVTPGQRRSMP